MRSMTPVLAVDAIEPCLTFWVDRLGFRKVAEVPHEGALGFVILVRDEVTVMLQSRASVAADLTTLSAAEQRTQDLLYLKCDDLDAVIEALDGLEPAVPRRETFYGAHEVGYRDPAGNVVLFSVTPG